MNLTQELKKCLINKIGSPEEVIANYSKNLAGSDEKGLLKATVKLFGAYCASPAFDKSRQLDILAENNKDMKILRVLIRDYDQGVENILDTYDGYYQLEDKKDFWDFFNKKLNLPDNWLGKAKLEANLVGEVPYGTGLDDYGDTPDIYPDDFDDELNKMLDEKGV